MINDDDKTQKRHQSQPSEFDEEEDMPDAKDFDEFQQEPSLVLDNDESMSDMQVKVQIVDPEHFKHHARNASNIVNYNLAMNSLGSKNQHFRSVKEDRNSLVNYDNSLLTHNTVRDNNLSPESEGRVSKPNTYCPKEQDCFNIKKDMQDQRLIPQIYEYNLTKTDDDYQLDESQIIQSQEELKQSNSSKASLENKYRLYMVQSQNEEEKAIEQITDKILQSDVYKRLKSDREKAHYLSENIVKIRRHFKQKMIDEIFAKAEI